MPFCLESSDFFFFFLFWAAPEPVLGILVPGGKKMLLIFWFFNGVSEIGTQEIFEWNDYDNIKVLIYENAALLGFKWLCGP